MGVQRSHGRFIRYPFTRGRRIQRGKVERPPGGELTDGLEIKSLQLLVVCPRLLCILTACEGNAIVGCTCAGAYRLSECWSKGADRPGEGVHCLAGMGGSDGVARRDLLCESPNRTTGQYLTAEH